MNDPTRSLVPADLPPTDVATTDLAPAVATDAATTDQPRATPGDPTVTYAGPAGHGPPAPPAAASSRYRVVRHHQSGGLGRVWLARDEVVGRDVALKTIRTDRAGHPSTRARFLREARVTGRLEHPSVVPLYDLGDGGDPFYVMRFVSGRTLAEATADYHRRRRAGTAGPLDLTALLDAFVGVCRAVAFAHSKDVLHRDLKGPNVVVGEYGEVFLLDWGLAKAAGEADPADDGGVADGGAEVTTAGSVVGTPAYLAPEVAAGGPASKASDVDGLGAMLYAVLTDHSPYTGTTATAVLKQVATTDPPPVASVNPAAPRPLAAVCRKAMSRDPAGRYPSADALATEVRRWLADEPVAAYPEPWAARLARWAKRRKTAVVGTAVLLLTAAVASSVAAALIWREQRQTRIAWRAAEAEEKKATANAETAVQVVRDLTAFVGASETTGGQGVRDDRQRKQALTAALASYERLLDQNPDDAEVRSNLIRLHRVRANLCRLLNETAEAETSYQAALRFATAAVEADPSANTRETHALTSRDYGVYVMTLGRTKAALDILDRTVAVYDKLRQDAPADLRYNRNLAGVLIDRADLLYQLGRLPEAETAARTAVALFNEVADLPSLTPDPTEPLFRSMADTRLGLVLRELGRKDEAVAAFAPGIDRLTALAKANPTRDVVYQLNRAKAERGWTAGSVADLDASITGMEGLAKQFPAVPAYPLSHAYALFFRGKVHAAAGRGEAAGKDLATAAKLLDGLVQKHPTIPVYASYLGQTYTALGRQATTPAEADGLFQKARQALDRAVQLNPDSAQYRRALDELAAAAAAPPRR